MVQHNGSKLVTSRSINTSLDTRWRNCSLFALHLCINKLLVFSAVYNTLFKTLPLFFSKLYSQIQELHTQRLTSLAKWSAAFKISQSHLKSYHLQTPCHNTTAYFMIAYTLKITVSETWHSKSKSAQLEAHSQPNTFCKTYTLFSMTLQHVFYMNRIDVESV